MVKGEQDVLHFYQKEKREYR